MALMLRTEDPVSLVGYVPRYHCADLSKLAPGNDLRGPAPMPNTDRRRPSCASA
jgi:hypothetical protein